LYIVSCWSDLLSEETEVPGEIHRLCHIMKGTCNVRAGTIDTWCNSNQGMLFYDNTRIFQIYYIYKTTIRRNIDPNTGENTLIFLVLEGHDGLVCKVPIP